MATASRYPIAVVSAAVVFFALHLPYLPASLEDVDSINFALGMRRFDVAHHQPHPPGYPVFIAAARAMRGVVAAEPVALGAVSAVAASLGLVALFALIEALAGPGTAFVATLLAATTPLYWFTASRPLSDSMGLAAAVAVQAMVVRYRRQRSTPHPATLTASAFLAGLASGIRSQVAWLTVPLLIAVCARLKPRARWGAIVGSAFAAGVLVWFVPLVVLTGGPAAYWHAVFDQGAEDLSGIRMLWTSPTARTLVEALYYAFIAPWAVWILAVPVLALAAQGIVILWKRNRAAVVLLAVAFAPYFLFDLLFQETFTVRYALPLVVPVCMSAAVSITAMPRGVALPVALAVAMYGAHIGGRSIAAYSRQPAPVFRMLADMRASQSAGIRPVLAPDRRASFDLPRPIAWLVPDAPRFESQLPSPPQHEWREAVKYWNGGGRAPVWFVVDPRRAAMDLIQHDDPRRYRYELPFAALMSGTRPADMDWYAIDHPDWYVGDGWSLTPEAAGVSQELASFVGLPRTGWIRHEAASGGSLLLGGRNFGRPVEMSGFVGADVRLDATLPSGPFLITRRLPSHLGTTGDPYLPMSVRPSGMVGDVALEQFDVSSSRAVVGFGAGWHEREFNPVTGQLWRWLSDRGELVYMTNGRPALLRIRGETPLRYYSKPSRLRIRLAEKLLLDTTVTDDFTVDVPLPQSSEPATLVVETDQTHVPAEQGLRRSADRRRLGLRVYSCAFVAATASAPGTAANSPPAR